MCYPDLLLHKGYGARYLKQNNETGRLCGLSNKLIVSPKTAMTVISE